MEVLIKQKAFIEAIGKKSTESVVTEMQQAQPSVDDWRNMLNFLGSALGEKNVEGRALKAKLNAVQEKIDQVKAKLDSNAALAEKKRKVAEVEIEVAEAGEFTFEVAYLIYNASWKPMYDARVESEQKKVTLRYMGMVTQRTGEDWKGVAIKLSTARPHIGGDPPKLAPWYVKEHVPRPAPRKRAMAKGRRSERFADIDGAPEEKERGIAVGGMAPGMQEVDEIVDASFEEARVEKGSGSSVVFTTKGSSDVPGDGSEGKLLIMEGEFGNKFRYLTIPKLAEHVYLTAEVENNTEFPLLPGKVSIFLDGNFVGKATLENLVTPEETFDLNLGVDEGIRVKHKLVRKKGDEKGLFSKSKVQAYAYLITIENLRNSAEEIVVRDQLPVSQDEKIKVQVEAISPDENPEKDKDALPNGTVEWKLNVPAKSEQKLELGFSIAYPRDLKVVGLR